jgi:Ca2+-binding EF-hand superfamily protein
MTIFKAFDTENNGSVSTEELLKLWLRGKDMTDKPYTMYQLLYRHFR